MTTPTASPWLSPHVVTEKSFPNVFGIVKPERWRRSQPSQAANPAGPAGAEFQATEGATLANLCRTLPSAPHRWPNNPFTSPALWLLVATPARRSTMILNYLSQIPRRVGVAAAATLLLSSSLSAQPAPTPAATATFPASTPPGGAALRASPPENEPVVLNLPDTDIDTILTVLETLTGRQVIRPQQLQVATYNVRIKNPLPKSEALLYIETVLALNNIGIAPLGEKLIKVVDAGRVRTEAPEMITGSAFDYPPSGRVASKLFQLEFARVAEVTPLFAGLINPLYGGPVPLQNANAVLITDGISNLQRVELLLQQVDKPISSGMKPKFYGPLRNAKASDVVNKLKTILSGTLQQQIGTATNYNADDRTNQIVLVTDPRQHAFFDELIERLDQKSDPNTRIDVIYLKHAKAVDIATVLNRIITGQNTAVQRQNPTSVRPGQVTPPPAGPAAPGAPPPAPTIVSASGGGGGAEGANEFSAVMSVVNEERSNSIVVFGTADDLRLIRTLIDKLDIVLPQVRIEVVIAEVSLSDTNQTGISELGLQISGDKLVGFNFATPGLGISGEGNGSFASITRPGASGPWDLAGIISITTTPRKNNTTILSHPAIVTSHGKVSEIFSGETRPVVTGSVTSGTVGGTTSTTTQLRIGTRLNVTPFIGVDGSVQLELKQTVEDVTDEIIIDGNPQPIIGTRETTSYITAKSGDIIVLGGFQKNTGVRTTSRLGPIPIIGDLFGSRRRQENRQDLIFFLRPIVLTNRPDVDNAETMRRLEGLPHREDVKRHLQQNSSNPAPLDLSK